MLKPTAVDFDGNLTPEFSLSTRYRPLHRAICQVRFHPHTVLDSLCSFGLRYLISGAKQVTASMAPGHGWRAPVIRYVAGLVLLATALLKILGTSVSGVPAIGWLSSPRVQLTVIQGELFVAVWLLSGYVQRSAWLAAFATFLTFAAASGYLGWIGQVDCGCLGPIRASPWYMFGFDIAAVAVLWTARPKLRPDWGAAQLTWKRWAAPAILAGSVGAFVFGGAYLAFGSIEGAAGWLRGDALSFSTRHVDFGQVLPGEARRASIDVRNRSDRPIRLLGGTQTGVLSVTSGLPLTLQPGETFAVAVNFSVPRWNPGLVTHSVELLTDDTAQRRVRLQVTCRVK